MKQQTIAHIVSTCIVINVLYVLNTCDITGFCVYWEMCCELKEIVVIVLN